MQCDCGERDWFVWYLYIERDKNSVYRHYRLEFPPGSSWTDWIGERMVTDYKLFALRSTDENGNDLPFVTSFGRLALFEAIDFRKELSEMFIARPGLRDELSAIKETIGDDFLQFASPKPLDKLPTETTKYDIAL